MYMNVYNLFLSCWDLYSRFHLAILAFETQTINDESLLDNGSIEPNNKKMQGEEYGELGQISHATKTRKKLEPNNDISKLALNQSQNNKSIKGITT